MARLRLVHWNLQEAQAKAELLRSQGHEVLVGGGYQEWKREPVDGFVIDLSRLPSHGREVAAALRAAKATRQIPILFVEGEPEKVQATREILPDAVYTSWPRLPGALQKLKPLENPVVPVKMMGRYAGRTTAQKLGIQENTGVTVVDPPRDYVRVLGELPAGVELSEDPGALSPVTLCFARDAEALPDILALGRKIAGTTKFWVCWPKGRKKLISEGDIRNTAIELGLVDYKVCSLDAMWSGLALAVRKV